LSGTDVEPTGVRSAAAREGVLQASTARLAVSGFFLAGLLFSFLGAILPAWGYHLVSAFSTAGAHFLMMAIGILGGSLTAHRLLARKDLRFVLVLGSGVACVSLVYLSLVSLRTLPAWTLVGTILLGCGAGLICSGLFHGISGIYRHDPAATVNIVGVLFTLGSLVMAMIVAGAFYVYTVGSTLFLLALIPGFFAVLFARSHIPLTVEPEQRTWSEAWADFRSPVAWMFAVLLFFQFGNEWSIAGWLTIFLVQRIGVSPATSLMMLALYWLALLVGRIVAQFLLPRVRHARLLGFGVLAAMFGCIVLGFTRSAFGAVSGIVFLGGGFAVVYPLVVEMIGHRFPRFHPGLFNGIFAFAMTGGLLAPWTLGFLADWFGIGALMLVPLGGTMMVTLSLGAIWLEAKLTGAKTAA